MEAERCSALDRSYHLLLLRRSACGLVDTRRRTVVQLPRSKSLPETAGSQILPLDFESTSIPLRETPSKRRRRPSAVAARSHGGGGGGGYDDGCQQQLLGETPAVSNGRQAREPSPRAPRGWRGEGERRRLEKKGEARCAPSPLLSLSFPRWFIFFSSFSFAPSSFRLSLLFPASSSTLLLFTSRFVWVLRASTAPSITVVPLFMGFPPAFSVLSTQLICPLYRYSAGCCYGEPFTCLSLVY